MKILQMQFICMQKEFWNKKIGECHDLYLKSDTLLLAVFENFWNICLKIHELDLVKFSSAPGIFLQKVTLQIGLNKFLWLKKLKIPSHG